MPNEEQEDHIKMTMLQGSCPQRKTTSYQELSSTAAPCSPSTNHGILYTPLRHPTSTMTPLNLVVKTSDDWICSNPPPLHFNKIITTDDALDNRTKEIVNEKKENKNKQQQEQENMMIVNDEDNKNTKSGDETNHGSSSSSCHCYLLDSSSLVLEQKDHRNAGDARRINGLNCIELDPLPSLMIPDLLLRCPNNCNEGDDRDQSSFISIDDDDLDYHGFFVDDNKTTSSGYHHSSTDIDDDNYHDQLYVQEEMENSNSMCCGINDRSLTKAVEDDFRIIETRTTCTAASRDGQIRLNLRPRKRKRGRTQVFPPSSW